MRAPGEKASLMPSGWINSRRDVRNFIEQPDLPVRSHGERTFAPSRAHGSLEVMERERQLAPIGADSHELARLIRADQQRRPLLGEHGKHAVRAFVAHLAECRCDCRVCRCWTRDHFSRQVLAAAVAVPEPTASGIAGVAWLLCFGRGQVGRPVASRRRA